MSRYDDQAYYRLQMAQRRNAQRMGNAVGQVAQSAVGSRIGATTPVTPAPTQTQTLAQRAPQAGASVAPAAPPASPAQAPADQMGPPNPMDRARMQEAAQRLMQDRRATMEGFRTLGPIYGQTPEQAAARAALTQRRAQLDRDLPAITGQLNPPQTVNPTNVDASRQRLMAQIAQAQAQGYGNQPSVRDQRPMTGDDYRNAQLAQRMGLSGDQFNQMRTLATPVTPAVVAGAEQTLGRPVGNFAGIQVAAQQQPQTGAMGPEVPLQVRLANAFAANDAANAARPPAPMPDTSVAARDAMERFMVQDNARKLAEQQARDLEAAQGNLAVRATQAEAMQYSPENVQANIDAARQNTDYQQRIQALTLQRQLRELERGAAGDVVSAPNVQAPLQRIDTALSIFESPNNLTPESAQVARSFAADVGSLITQARSMTPEQRRGLRDQLRTTTFGRVIGNPSATDRLLNQLGSMALWTGLTGGAGVSQGMASVRQREAANRAQTQQMQQAMQMLEQFILSND